MSEANKSFTKVIIISVIMVLVIAVLLYLLPMAFKNESNGSIVNVNPIDKIMEKITNVEEDDGEILEEIQDDNIEYDESEEAEKEEEMNEKRDSYGNIRRYLESTVEICESDEFILPCEEFEFEFSDETGCGCELTKEQILLEEEMLKQMEEMEDVENSEEEMPEPIACTMEYAPVCGELDGELQTFGNDCMAEASGVLDYTEGECK